MSTPKRHHYVPKVYLRFFADDDERVVVYRKGTRCEPQRRHIGNVAVEGYYYSQITEAGSWNHAIERLLGDVETPWPLIVTRLRARQLLSDEEVRQCSRFLLSMRVRGPATRDFIELAHADHVRAAGLLLWRNGRLPPVPPELEGALRLDRLEIAIDPEESLHAMPHLALGYAALFQELRFFVVHNATEVDIITSDNPVLIFDPATPEHNIRPYRLARGGAVEMLFPVAPDMAIVGLSGRVDESDHRYSRHVLANVQDVKRINRLVTRFGYREVYARHENIGNLLLKYGMVSPVLSSQTCEANGGYLVTAHWEFGSLTTKPSWSRAKEREAE